MRVYLRNTPFGKPRKVSASPGFVKAYFPLSGRIQGQRKGVSSKADVL
jgi:hypothetical protein